MTYAVPMGWPQSPTYTFDVLLHDRAAQGYLQRALTHLGDRVDWSMEMDTVKHGQGATFYRIETGPRDAPTVQALVRECDEMEQMPYERGVETMRFQ